MVSDLPQDRKQGPPASVGASQLRDIQVLTYSVLAADSAYNGLSTADVWQALGKTLSIGMVREALSRLTQEGKAFNTTCDDRFAAL